MEKALVLLLRHTFARSGGVRAARILAIIALLAGTSGAVLLAYRFGQDGSVLALAARTAAGIVSVVGFIVALAIAQPPKDRTAESGVLALARAHAFAANQLRRAAILAWIELTCEVVFLPIAVLCLVAAGMSAAGGPEGLMVLAGTALFGLLASVIIGAVSFACRQWGGDRGRRWLLGVVLVPWVLAQSLFSERAAAYLSIPGLLGQAWTTLTGMGS